MIFYTADLHLGYFPILHDTARPFSGVPEMDEALIPTGTPRRRRRQRIHRRRLLLQRRRGPDAVSLPPDGTCISSAATTTPA